MATDQILIEYKAKLDRLEKQVKGLGSKFDSVDRNVKKSRESIKGFEKQGNQLIGSLKNVGAALGVAFGAQQIVQGIREIINVNKEFEKSLSTLSSITGATGKDLQFFEEQAKRIGATTTLSATQASEAFTLIGSAQPELLKIPEALVQVTDSAAVLAEASGLELPAAADALTTSLNQFGLSAESADRVINVLAASSKEGAVAIPTLAESIRVVGTVASSAGLSIEQTSGLIETLGQKGIRGAQAGTQLRNVILRLQQAGIGFVNGTFDINAALDELRERNISTQEATRLFGLESATAGKILVDNIDTYKDLTEAITDTNVAQEQAETNTDNLEGSIDRFNSTIEKAILEGGSFNNVLRRIVDTAAAVVDAFVNTEEQSTGVQVAVSVLKNAFETFITPVKFVIEIFKQLFSAAGEIIGIFGEVFSVFGKTEDATGKTRDAMGGLQTAFNLLSGPLGLVKEGMGLIVDGLKSFVKFIKQGKDNIVDFIQNGIDLFIVATNKAAEASNRFLGTEFERIKTIKELLKEQKRQREEEKARRKEIEETMGILAERAKQVEQERIQAQAQEKLRQESIVTLSKLKAELQDLKKAREDINLEDRSALAINAREIERLDQRIKRYEELGFTLEETEEKTEELSEAEKKRIKDAEDIAKRNIAAEQELSEFRATQGIDALDRIAENENATSAQRIEAVQRRVEEEKKLAIDKAAFEVSNSNATAEEQELIEEQLQEKLTEIDRKGAEDRKKINDEEFKQRINNIQKGLETAREIGGLVTEAFRVQSERKLSRLEQEKEKELENFEGTEEQKEQIEEKFRQKEAEIKRKQAQKDKAAALFEIAIQGAIAAVKAFNTPVPPNFALLALSLAQTAAQSALVLARPIPQFASGVEGFEGGLAKVHKDELMYLPTGTSVFTKKASGKYADEINAMNTGNYDDLLFMKYIQPALKEQLSAIRENEKNDMAHRMVEAMKYQAFDDYEIVRAIKKPVTLSDHTVEQLSFLIGGGKSKLRRWS